jgi:hypothetical protein
MFYGCCLDKKSIEKIASSIKKLSVNPSEDDENEGVITLGIDSSLEDNDDDENKGVIHLGIDSRLKDDSEVKEYLA